MMALLQPRDISSLDGAGDLIRVEYSTIGPFVRQTCSSLFLPRKPRVEWNEGLGVPGDRNPDRIGCIS